MRKFLSLFLVIIIVFSMVACSNREVQVDNKEGLVDATTSDQIDSNSINKIRFSQSLEELKKYDGKTVTINGFMSLLSPLDGTLIYLMNIPFQSCPFCIPNTNTLSNTIAVAGSNIQFTPMPVKITGKLVFDDFTDGYGYEYSYRIEDAEIVELDENEVSEKTKVYYTVAQEDYIGELYFIMDCVWQVGYYEEIGLSAEELESYGIILFDRYASIKSSLESLNANGEYDAFLEMLNQAEDARIRVNQDLENGNAENYPSYKAEADEMFEKFYAFINEYEF